MNYKLFHCLTLTFIISLALPNIAWSSHEDLAHLSLEEGASAAQTAPPKTLSAEEEKEKKRTQKDLERFHLVQTGRFLSSVEETKGETSEARSNRACSLALAKAGAMEEFIKLMRGLPKLYEKPLVMGAQVAVSFFTSDSALKKLGISDKFIFQQLMKKYPGNQDLREARNSGPATTHISPQTPLSFVIWGLQFDVLFDRMRNLHLTHQDILKSPDRNPYLEDLSGPWAAFYQHVLLIRNADKHLWDAEQSVNAAEIQTYCAAKASGKTPPSTGSFTEKWCWGENPLGKVLYDSYSDFGTFSAMLMALQFGATGWSDDDVKEVLGIPVERKGPTLLRMSSILSWYNNDPARRGDPTKHIPPSRNGLFDIVTSGETDAYFTNQDPMVFFTHMAGPYFKDLEKRSKELLRATLERGDSFAHTSETFRTQWTTFLRQTFPRRDQQQDGFAIPAMPGPDADLKKANEDTFAEDIQVLMAIAEPAIPVCRAIQAELAKPESERNLHLPGEAEWVVNASKIRDQLTCLLLVAGDTDSAHTKSLGRYPNAAETAQQKAFNAFHLEARNACKDAQLLMLAVGTLYEYLKAETAELEAQS